MFKLSATLFSVSTLALTACGGPKTVIKKPEIKVETKKPIKKKSSGGGGGGSSSSSSKDDSSATPVQKMDSPYNVDQITLGTKKNNLTYNLGVFGFDFSTGNSKSIKEAVDGYALDKAVTPGLGSTVTTLYPSYATAYPGLILTTSPVWNFGKDYNPIFNAGLASFKTELAKSLIIISGLNTSNVKHSVKTQADFDKLARTMYLAGIAILPKNNEPLDGVVIKPIVTVHASDVNFGGIDYTTAFAAFKAELAKSLKVVAGNGTNATHHSVKTINDFNKVATFMYDYDDVTLAKAGDIIDSVAIKAKTVPHVNDVVVGGNTYATDLATFKAELAKKLKVEVGNDQNSNNHSVNTTANLTKVAIWLFKNDVHILKKDGDIIDGVTIKPQSGHTEVTITGFVAKPGQNMQTIYANDFDQANGPLLTNVDTTNTKPLNLAFLDSEDGWTNTKKLYETLVDGDNDPTTTDYKFKDSHLVMIGARSDKMNDSGTITAKDWTINGNISTASFDDRITAFLAGFQATIKAIKYDTVQNKFVKTKVGFWIANVGDETVSTCTNNDGDKATMFINGIKAATKHPEYRNLLDVQFVNEHIKGGTMKDNKCYKSDELFDKNNNIFLKALQSETMTKSEVDIIYLANFPAIASDTPKKRLFSNNTNGGKAIIDNIKTDFNMMLDNEYAENASSGNELENKQVHTWGFTNLGYESKPTHLKEKNNDAKTNREDYIKSFMTGYFFGGPNYMIGNHTYYGTKFKWIEEMPKNNTRKIGYGLNNAKKQQTKSKELVQEAYYKAISLDIAGLVDDFNSPTFTD